MTYVVAIKNARGCVYGPFDSDTDAKEFAEFLTAEVDPATVHRLIPPEDELLGWWRNQRHGETRPLAEEGTWPPLLADIWQDRRGERWTAVVGDQLLHLGRQDGAAPHQEIWRLFGPLTLIYRPDIREPEVPF